MSVLLEIGVHHPGPVLIAGISAVSLPITGKVKRMRQANSCDGWYTLHNFASNYPAKVSIIAGTSLAPVPLESRSF